MERIVVEHLKDGRVVEEHVFHRLGAPAVEGPTDG
jgi:(2Fe-2S) ferredoxin